MARIQQFRLRAKENAMAAAAAAKKKENPETAGKGHIYFFCIL
jgi:hypothetical protein